MLLAWARLGPLSLTRPVKVTSDRRLVRGCFRREHAPNGVAWRFPDWKAVGCRDETGGAFGLTCFMFPDPVPRIGIASRAVARALCAAWVRCSASRESLTPRCGTPLAATLTRIAAGRFFARCRVAWSLAAGPAVPALACFARRRFTPLGRSSYLGAFSNFVDQFPARRRRRNIKPSRKNTKFFRVWPNGYPPRGCNFRRVMRLAGA